MRPSGKWRSTLTELAKVMAQYGRELVGMVVYGGVLRSGRVLNGPFSRLMWLLASSAGCDEPVHAARVAVELLIRSVTMIGYRPKKLRAAREST